MVRPRGLVDAFYATVLEQALGFFGSKVVNPRLEPSIGHGCGGLHRPGGSARFRPRATASALKTCRACPGGPRALHLRDPEQHRAVTRVLGQVLGDKPTAVYVAIGKAGAVASTAARPFEEEGPRAHLLPIDRPREVGRTRFAAEGNQP